MTLTFSRMQITILSAAKMMTADAAVAVPMEWTSGYHV